MPNEIRNYIIGIIAFTFVIVGGIAMMSSLNSTGEGFTNNEQFTSFNDSFNKFDDVTEQVTIIKESVSNPDADQGPFGFLDALIGASWATLKGTFASFSFMGDVFNSASTIFGIPAWIPSLVFFMVIILIAYAIISAIFNR